MPVAMSDRPKFVMKRTRDDEDDNDEIKEIKPLIRPRRSNSPTPTYVTPPPPTRPLRDVPKHPQFYYEDGSVVLVTAQRTASPSNRFRVSRSQLERSSPKLRAILADALTKREGEEGKVQMFEGCPVVWLDESTVDVEALFEVLWGGPIANSNERSSEFVIGVLRLSTKWELPQLRGWSLGVLFTKIPTTYEHFAKDPALFAFSTWIAPTKVLQLHDEFGLAPMAALAWYHLATVNWAEQPREVRAHLLSMPTDNDQIDAPPTQVNMEKLVIGRERLHDMCLDFWHDNPVLLRFETSPCAGASRGGRVCASRTMRRGQAGKASLKSLLRFPLSWHMAFAPVSATSFCNTCGIQVKILADAFTKKVFADLAVVFEV